MEFDDLRKHLAKYGWELKVPLPQLCCASAAAPAAPTSACSPWLGSASPEAGTRPGALHAEPKNTLQVGAVRGGPAVLQTSDLRFQQDDLRFTCHPECQKPALQHLSRLGKGAPARRGGGGILGGLCCLVVWECGQDRFQLRQRRREHLACQAATLHRHSDLLCVLSVLAGMRDGVPVHYIEP